MPITINYIFMGNLVTSHNSRAHGVLLFDQLIKCRLMVIQDLIIMGLRSWPAGVAYQAQSDVIWHFRDSLTLSINELGLGTLQAYISDRMG